MHSIVQLLMKTQILNRHTFRVQIFFFHFLVLKYLHVLEFLHGTICWCAFLLCFNALCSAYFLHGYKHTIDTQHNLTQTNPCMNSFSYESLSFYLFVCMRKTRTCAACYTMYYLHRYYANNGISVTDNQPC